MSQKKKFDLDQFCRRIEDLIGNQDDAAAQVFWRAFSFAVDAHSGQLRKSGEAYVSHPCEVAMILIDELGIRDPDTLAAAVLHDTVEDCPEVTCELVGELFGRKIEVIVDGCTKIDSFAGDRQTFYNLVHRKIFSGAADEVAVILVKLADRLHNLRTMDSMPRHKRQKIAEETLNIYAPLAKVMGLFSLKRELYNLALSYKFPRQSQKVQIRIRQLEQSPEAQAIRDRLQTEFERAWMNVKVMIRGRGLSAYYDPERKVLTGDAEQPVQIIIVVDDIQSCYRALGILNQNFPPIPRTIRDFIANPKPTGYQSLHAKANIKGFTYLFKIRDREMMSRARSGIIREWLQAGKMPSGFEREIREMFDILGSDDNLSYRDVIAASEKEEIYTFTPKGERICLPRGSLVLDFAFKVHTEVGSHCIAAYIDQRRVGPEHRLADGDRVRVVTSDRPVRFDPRIHQLCQSPRARSQIARLFRMRVENLARQNGQSMLRQELKRYGIDGDVLDQPELLDILAYFGLESREELYAAIGAGIVRLRELIYEIRHGLWAGREVLQPPAGILNRLELMSLDPVSVKLSRCCNPLPTTSGLLGLLSPRGLSVHRNNCRRLEELGVARDQVVELRWNLKQAKIEREQTMIVVEAPRQRLLMLLATAPEAMRLTELIPLFQQAAKVNDWEIRFKVETLYDLKNVLQHFSKAGMVFEFGLEL